MTNASNFTPQIEIVIVDERLKEWGLPKYESEMAAAIDLFASIPVPIQLPPGTAPVLIGTGFRMHIANPFVAAQLLPRSGQGHKGLVLGNLVGLIDADYTGEVKVSAWNRNPDGEPIVIHAGMRLAQMIFVPVIRPTFSVVSEFSAASDRGAGGFGSTGS